QGGGGGGGNTPPNLNQGYNAFNAMPPPGGNMNVAQQMNGYNQYGLNANSLYGPARRPESHNARWFVAGVLTGWLLKRHFANKKLQSVQAQAKKNAAAQ